MFYKLTIIVEADDRDDALDNVGISTDIPAMIDIQPLTADSLHYEEAKDFFSS